MRYNLVFITTYIDDNNIYSLIDSISNNNHNLKIYIVIVNQTTIDLNYLLNNRNLFIYEIKVSKQSLSSARNIGIKHILRENILFDFILFPDDDSSFDDSFFKNFLVVVENHHNYIIDVYGLHSKELYIPNNLSNNSLIKNIYPQVAMSVNMLINFSTFNKVVFFDENMGVGAPYGAGEDSDYFLRCVKESGPFIYMKELWNFHPKFENKHNILPLKILVKKYKNYGKGVIYLHYKHGLYYGATKQCINALLGALFALFIKMDIKLSIARVNAFLVRSYTYLFLLLKIYK